MGILLSIKNGAVVYNSKYLDLDSNKFWWWNIAKKLCKLLYFSLENLTFTQVFLLLTFELYILLIVVFYVLYQDLRVQKHLGCLL